MGFAFLLTSCANNSNHLTNSVYQPVEINFPIEREVRVVYVPLVEKAEPNIDCRKVTDAPNQFSYVDSTICR
jgi:hypothetical protein